MARARQERNRAVVRLRKQGVEASKIAAEHGLSCGRITQIVAANGQFEERRTVLEARYGRQPDIASLGDSTPLDVLTLINVGAHGWASRIRSLSTGRNPLRTLGDLRRLTDAELQTRPGVGSRLFAELRAVCPRARARPRKAAQPETV